MERVSPSGAQTQLRSGRHIGAGGDLQTTSIQGQSIPPRAVTYRSSRVAVFGWGGRKCSALEAEVSRSLGLPGLEARHATVRTPVDDLVGLILVDALDNRCTEESPLVPEDDLDAGAYGGVGWAPCCPSCSRRRVCRRIRRNRDVGARRHRQSSAAKCLSSRHVPLRLVRESRLARTQKSNGS